MSQEWIHNEVVSAVLHRLLDLLDRKPAEERTRPAGFRINAKELPCLFNQATQEDIQFSWDLVKEAGQAGWITLSLGKAKPGHAEYELNPRVILNFNAEEEIRNLLGREIHISYGEQWRQAIEMSKDLFPGDATKIAQQPICIDGRTADEVVERLRRLPELRTGVWLREASSTLFWGLSKKLDNRLSAIQDLLGEQCPIQEKPVLLNAHIPFQNIESLIFIENEETYQLLTKNMSWPCLQNTALIWTQGFKGSAKRIRADQGSYFHYSQDSENEGIQNFERIWQGNLQEECYFFGDLDYSGMAILKSLREVFPYMKAWQPGYRVLLEKLQKDEAHTPESADKENQFDPSTTGCKYADTVLLPALREYGCFVDQEIGGVEL